MRTLLPSLLLLTGCIIIVDDDPVFRDDEPVEVDRCDVDADGSVSAECGGDDCDDGDPSIYPGAAEVFGDDIDQDCDGELDLQVDVVDLPDRVDGLGWRWSSDLRSLGGVIVTQSGELASQQLEFGGQFGEPLRGKQRSLYRVAPAAPVQAVRVQIESGPVDVVAWSTGGQTQVELWRPGQQRGELIDALTWDLPEGKLDAWVDDDSELWVAGCGDEGVNIELIDPVGGTALGSWTLDVSADSCTLMAPTGRATLLIAHDGQLTRWRLSADEGPVDWLRLAQGLDVVDVRAVTQGSVGTYALLEASGWITVFDGAGHGTVAGEGKATAIYDLAITEQGDVSVVWLDDQERVWTAVGPSTGPLVAGGWSSEQPVTSLSAGLLDGELATAVQVGADLVLLRALR